MDYREAISILKTWRVFGDKEHEALNMAISVLQEQDSPKPIAESVQDVQNEDLISRKAAIEAFMTTTSDGDKADWCKWVLERLPSAQPNLQPTCNQLAKDKNVPCKDTISRQAVIDELMSEPPEMNYGFYYAEKIKAMTSAQSDVPDINVGDMISREELFEELNCINLPVGNETVDKIFSVIENMPSAQPEHLVNESRTLVKDLVKDTISRQAAIDIVTGYSEQLNGYIGTPNDTDVYAYARGLILGIERNLNALQSAQTEIIYCRDCIHAIKDGLCGGYWCKGKAVKSSHFCGYAERRTDE